MPRRLLACTALFVLLAILLFDALFEIVVARVLQHSLMALGAGAVTIGAVHARPWQLELKDFMVGNAPGNWSVPMALHIGSAHWNFGTLGGLLSLHPGGLMRCGCLEFTLGFRIKVLEQIEFERVTVLLEDANSTKVAAGADGFLRRGELRKEPLNGHLGTKRLRDFVLEETLLSWYEPGELGVDPRFIARPKGKLRLFPSSVVEVGGGDDACTLTLISSADTLTMVAANTVERDAWAEALQRAIRGLASGATRPTHSNAPWLEAQGRGSRSCTL